MVPLAYGETFQRLLPNSTLKVIDRCGHCPHQERPAEFVEAVLGFLQG
jgi:pimeloyl-ACP methyl ester carboxylesterase